MHKRYNFELIENDPNFKSFSTIPSSLNQNDECWIYLTHNYEELEMIFKTNTYMKNPYDISLSLWKRVANKLKLCYKIFKNEKIEFESSFIFRGRNHIEDFADMILLLSKEVKQETNELIEAKKELRQLKR
jgi:hypothetical protein